MKKNSDIDELTQQVDMLKRIFDSIHSGAVVTDSEGYITHFNKAYGEFLNVNPDEQIGKHCTEVIENTRMHIVAKTQKPEIARSQHIRGENMIVQRIPIKKDGRVIGVFGLVMFRSAKEVQKLARKLDQLESKVKLYEEELMNLRSTRYTFDSIVAKSSGMNSLKEDALKAASQSYPVLITGDSGTGKELFAQAIHNASPRRTSPFIRVNCSAIPKDLMESELFGYEKGAFTGARVQGKPGKFELAHRGSIFLDEMSELPLEVQPKLLRVLEEKEFERIGGNAIIQSDFRVIAATNQNLQRMVEDGKFRTDLFYRLSVIPIHIPPLADRREDIIPLSEYLLARMVEDAGLYTVSLADEAKEVLYGHDWPGNIRELKNVLERALSLLDGDVITRDDLPFYLKDRLRSHGGHTADGEKNRSELKKMRDKRESEMIRNALRSAGYNKARAARLLGIHRTLLYKKMKKYGIDIVRTA